MTPRLETVEEIFHAALQCKPDDLRAFLDERCASHTILQRKVEELLAAHWEAGDFIETPVADLSNSTIAEDHERDLLIGQTIGHYKVVRRIGAGGMGAVYLAERADQQYHKQVAIKLIKRGMDTDSVLRHFRNERQILAGFDHPNIARLLDGGATEDGLPYFVMEYVEGLPIDQYCEKHALSITDRLRLFREVSAAVSYAHRRAVIHRDIKPSNIVVTSEGSPKLLDFGIAKILQPSGGVEALVTITGVRLMTPEYASPEQVRGEAVTTASDIYSLGVVLYQLLTGQKPYRLKTRTPEEISRAILEQEPTRPSTAIARCDGGSKSPTPNLKVLRGDLDNIVLMALRKEPERRYQSVEQLSEDIRRHFQARPILARKDNVGYRAAKFVRRNTIATAAAALVFLTLLGGIVATTRQAHNAKIEKARAERRFNDVRHLAHSVLFEYHDAIKDLSGATRVREQLVKDGLTYLDSLAAEANGDPALQRELAAAYERVGDVRGQAFSASLGDMAGAMDSYKKALHIRQALLAAHPDDVQNKAGLAGIYQKIGNQSLETTEAGAGLQNLRKAMALYTELATEEPTNSEFRGDLAGIYNGLGMALEARGDESGALENHRKALPIREQLVAAEPRNQRYRQDLSVTYVNMARALVLKGDIKGGIESNQKGMTLCAALFAENPNNAKYRRLLAIAYQNDGDYRVVLGDTSGALESFRKKLPLDEQYLHDDPINAQARGDFAYSCHRIGLLLAKLGDYAQALPYHVKALGMLEKLAADAPEDLVIRYRTIITRTTTAEVHAKLGNRSEAEAECSTTMTQLNEIAEDPTNSALSDFRALACLHLADAYVALATSDKLSASDQQKHWRAAHDLYQRSLNIWQEMQRRGILTADDADKPDEVTRGIAKCDAALGK
ncbi:MAG TPA: protein kinase [Candidatus Udaeobacter sp.]